MALLFVTKNKWKVAEVQSVLDEFGISIVQVAKEIPESDLHSIEDIALDKAQKAFAELRKPLIVEDTGLYFKAYKDFPGTHPKRVFLSIGFDGIFRLLKGKDRSAKFKSVICFIESPERYALFAGEMQGKILLKAVKPGADVMPYDKIFAPTGKNKAIVEMPVKEKNEVSHRAVATRKLGKFLQEKETDFLVESI